MNRRYFLQAIGIGVACLALRIKPDAARELPEPITSSLDAFNEETINRLLEKIYAVRSNAPSPVIYCTAETYEKMQRAFKLIP